jgi:hypothetical protein
VPHCEWIEVFAHLDNKVTWIIDDEPEGIKTIDLGDLSFDNDGVFFQHNGLGG